MERTKIKILFVLALFVLLAFGSTGCCTYLLISSTHYETQDTFNPSALYEITNHNTIAMGGTRFKNVTDHGHANPGHVFVILPTGILPPPILQSNVTLSVSDVRTLPPDYAKEIKIKTHLPPTFAKISDCPTNNTTFVVGEHYPRRIRYIFVPFTLAADAATSPIQLACVVFIWCEMR
jgi:hypothetical protein